MSSSSCPSFVWGVSTIWSLADKQKRSAVSDIVKMWALTGAPPPSHTHTLLLYLIFSFHGRLWDVTVLTLLYADPILALIKACMAIIISFRFHSSTLVHPERTAAKLILHFGGKHDTYLYFTFMQQSVWISRALSPSRILTQCHNPYIEQNIVAGLVQWKGLKLKITYGLSSSNGLLCPWEPWLQAKLSSSPTQSEAPFQD